jgi:hypothetical protein
VPLDDSELVRRAFDDFNRVGENGNFSVDRATRELWVEEPWIVPMRAAVEATEYRGATALEDFNADNRDIWERLQAEPVEVESLSGRRILVRAVLNAVPRHGGVETTATISFLVERDGDRIASLRTFMDEAEARRAAG